MNWMKCEKCGQTWWPENAYDDSCPYCAYGHKVPVIVSTVDQLCYSIRMATPDVKRLVGILWPRPALRTTPRRHGGSVIVDIQAVPL